MLETSFNIIIKNMIKSKDLQKYIGNQVKRYRKLANLSQEQLAEKIGIATNSLSSIETGNSFMTVNTMEKILNILKLSPKDFFDFPEITENKTDMYEFIKNGIKIIEGNEEKMSLLYNFIKLLI